MSLIDVQRRLLTIDEVAPRLALSRRSVERKIRAGEMPALRLAGPRTALRVDERELNACTHTERPRHRAVEMELRRPVRSREDGAFFREDVA